MTNMTRVMVFGTFDGLHEGHRAFLRQARELGNELVVCLAADEVVEHLKGHCPDHLFELREAALRTVEHVTAVHPGDTELGVYTCVHLIKPGLVAFGYDQQTLAADFQRWQQERGDETPTVMLQPYRPETYKTSLLRRNPSV